MTAATAPRLEVCPEYQLLLQHCQQALVTLQQGRLLAARPSFAARDAAEQVQRLHDNYLRAHHQLETHEHDCQTCQYIAKIAGMDFDSMAEALIQHRRST
jgi:hypothetical protein